MCMIINAVILNECYEISAVYVKCWRRNTKVIQNYRKRYMFNERFLHDHGPQNQG